MSASLLAISFLQSKSYKNHQMKVRDKQYGVIWQVQRHLYKSLKSSIVLAKNKIQIFHQIPKNTPFPYLYLGKFLVFNNSLKATPRLQLMNEIHLYAQSIPIQNILESTEAIKKALTQDNVRLDSCYIGTISFVQMELDIMNDSKTYRVISKYKILVEE